MIKIVSLTFKTNNLSNNQGGLLLFEINTPSVLRTGMLPCEMY